VWQWVYEFPYEGKVKQFPYEGKFP
jgi:hypothetical protein